MEGSDTIARVNFRVPLTNEKEQTEIKINFEVVDTIEFPARFTGPAGYHQSGQCLQVQEKNLQKAIEQLQDACYQHPEFGKQEKLKLGANTRFVIVLNSVISDYGFISFLGLHSKKVNNKFDIVYVYGQKTLYCQPNKTSYIGKSEDKRVTFGGQSMDLKTKNQQHFTTSFGFPKEFAKQTTIEIVNKLLDEESLNRDMQCLKDQFNNVMARIEF